MLLLFLTVLLVSEFGAGLRRHGHHGLLLPPPNVHNYPVPPDQWFTQKLDHSQPSDLRTWQQRYFTNDTFYRPGGPVFLMIGGEGTASPVWMVTGSWIEYAEEHGALCFQLEHRFYGKSHPTEDMSVKNLRYLSSEQALADLATFSAAMEEKHALPEGTKWVAFGGSYPGSLAAWYRLKYPHMVHAAVSSSAPLVAKTNFYEFLEVVSDAVKAESGDTCYSNIAAAFTELEKQLADKKRWRPLGKLFRLCDPYAASDLNTSSLVSSLADLFEGTVQYNRDNREFEGAKDANITVSTLCHLMSDGAGSPLDRLAAVNAALMAVRGDKCLDYTYKSEMDKMRQESFDSPDNTGMRQWIYQTCNEFGWYQTSDAEGQPFGHRFPLTFSVQQCMDAYGTKFNQSFIDAAVAATNVRYGGRGIRVRRVVFINGSIDPWHAMGLTATRSRHAPVIYVNGTAHCANMYPSRDEDLPELKAARRRIGRLIARWLQEDDQ
ncbi:putative serine protease K12H4.7 isoform X2 [Amphibalanus amphitrite]|nr:putative serine protease K12H4.7 isoform X2 [Amphibalanus amphitrite]XP_043216352.1 putative serine protease K12H4.7 isoform X2 [Amphibalanus amphitrite]XP_043216353.1 putative serine protease K12H4.7 isoform X2 [Amphibalanus amphitrite]XP_043216354.1 putative serine protease K12H4.7 isoform X2 [Amphibalanus amphitrite]XP_043216355.1 putative serine protease K12H4.7 isoform X2 [Amphibalanus amphitrite]XP_043216356.1 putative serine protease K12H4.7 isoform X2 [Amphibalanus amphitrite]XP_04